jgi:hypothetical protein
MDKAIFMRRNGLSSVPQSCKDPILTTRSSGKVGTGGHVVVGRKWAGNSNRRARARASKESNDHKSRIVQTRAHQPCQAKPQMLRTRCAANAPPYLPNAESDFCASQTEGEREINMALFSSCHNTRKVLEVVRNLWLSFMVGLQTILNYMLSRVAFSDRASPGWHSASSPKPTTHGWLGCVPHPLACI